MKRGNPYPHRYKHGKIEEATDLQTFSQLMNKIKKSWGSFDVLFIKSLLALFYWTGLRKSEVVGAISHRYWTKKHGWKWTQPVKGIMKEDIWIKGRFFYVKAIARKHGKREAPLIIPLDLPYVDLIVEQWRRTPEKEKVWSISEVHVWRLIKDIAPNLYLHFFRFNRITKFCENPKLSIADICSWTGLTPQTIGKYLERSGRFIKRVAVTLKEEA
ncbi:hypothetical protein DRO69_02030 [Candidatus Bathyarchaeota archaeon]|nr:MAG: hypothetical protein DRO69_02030 [Candidatus Bathyarchaeota archaeon]